MEPIKFEPIPSLPWMQSTLWAEFGRNILRALVSDEPMDLEIDDEVTVEGLASGGPGNSWSQRITLSYSGGEWTVLQRTWDDDEESIFDDDDDDEDEDDDFDMDDGEESVPDEQMETATRFDELDCSLLNVEIDDLEQAANETLTKQIEAERLLEKLRNNLTEIGLLPD